MEIVVVLLSIALGLVAVYWPRRKPRVVFRDLKWGPSSNEQARDRARRIERAERRKMNGADR